MKLHTKLRPLPRESLLGFLRRVADAEFYNNTADFFDAHKFGYNSHLVNSVEVHEADLGLPEGSMIAITPTNYVQGLLDRRMERLQLDPICPECAALELPHLQAWRHKLVTACPIHALVLQSVCPFCDKTRTPRSGGWRACECGAPLADFKRQAAPEIAAQTSRLIGKVPVAPETLPIDLDDGIAPDDFGNFVYFIAASAMKRRTGKRLKTPLTHDVANGLKFIAHMDPILNDWPNGLHKLVTHLIAEAPTARQSVKSKLGLWYTSLQGFEHHAYARFRSEVEKCSIDLITHVDTSAPDKAPLANTANTDDQGRWLPLEIAAKRYGINLSTFKHAALSGRIPKKSALGFTKPQILIPEDFVDQQLRYRSGFISRQDAVSFLGLTKSQFKFLLELGVIHLVPTEERPLLFPMLSFRKSELVCLVDKAQSLPSSTANPEGGWVKTSDLTLQKTTDRKAHIELLKAICDGKLPSKPSDNPVKFADIELPKSAIDDFFDVFQTTHTFTANELAKATGWKNECIAHWCKLGLLKSTTVKAGSSLRLSIRASDVVRFTQDYIPLSQLAAKNGTQSSALLRKFAERGIHTVGAFPVGDTERGHLVRVSSLAELWSA